MAHDHHHSHGDRSTFYLNQLFTIAVCGALGAVAVLLWYTGKIKLLVVERFFLPVLAGGLALLALVLIRAVAVWVSVDEPADQDHEHGHDHAHEHEPCGHEHGACGHDHAHTHEHAHDHGHDHGHGHDHDHGWAPWRYVVLLLPVVLYFLNLPNEGFSAAYGDRSRGLQLDVPTSACARGGRPFEVDFLRLQEASLSPDDRAYFEGRAITLVGQYSSYSPTRFTLVRYKMNCCARDQVPLNAVILIDPNSNEKMDPDHYREKWVKVTGCVHFQKLPSNEYVTTLVLSPSKEQPLGQLVQIVPRPANVSLSQ